VQLKYEFQESEGFSTLTDAASISDEVITALTVASASHMSAMCSFIMVMISKLLVPLMCRFIKASCEYH
jgi:hypothetical protein